MSLVYWYFDPDDGQTEITDRCRLYQYRMKTNAEEGSVAVNTLLIDDPAGNFEPRGHRVIAVEETTAVDPYDRFVFVGFLGVCKVIRGPYRTGVSRQWSCEVSDLNGLLSRRILLGTDNNRPAETDVERIEWVESTDEGRDITDYRYLSAAGPVDMDAVDYTTQEAIAVYNDCAQQSGKNWFVTYFGDVGYVTRPWGSYSLWYDFAASSEYPSTVALSNDPALIDNVSVFPIYIEDEFTIDPMRIYSTIVVPYNNTYVTANRPDTQSNYAKRERTMPAENVRTKAVAQARANRYADDAQTPEHRATVKTIVPRASVNLIREGMLVDVQVTHWPEPYASEYVPMRVLTREVAEVSEDTHEAFELTLELSRGEPGPPAEAVFGILRLSKGPYGNVVYWGKPGDTPPPGYVVEPTVGPITTITDGDAPNPSWPYTGWLMGGSGTVDLRLFASVAGVLLDNILYSITFAITRNGTVVASEVITAQGHLQYWHDLVDVTVAAVSVSNGDVIAGTIICSPPTMPYFRTPSETGQNGEQLTITAGSLA